MKVVLFLGAGFSRAFGLPVMREFFEHVNQSSRLTDNHREIVRRLRTIARSSSSMLDGAHDNLEHILSLSLMAPDLAGESEDGLTMFDQLRLVLKKVYSATPVETVHAIRSSLEGLLRKKRSYTWEHQLTVITTNYDVLAEFGLWSLGMKPRLPFEWSHRTNVSENGAFLYSTSPSAPLLCKLHGSLNWFLAKNGASEIEAEARVVRVNGPMTIDLIEREYHLPIVSVGNYKEEFDTPPVIVPPTLYKQQSDDSSRQTWAAAHEAMREADRVVVIGYSFPPSDTYMKYFFASALVGNIDLPRITVIDPAASDIVHRLRSSDYGTHFKQLLHPVTDRWNETDISVVD